MKFISTTPNEERVSFKTAVLNGLTQNGALYFPEEIPQLPSSFFENIENLSDHEIAFTALQPYVQENLSDADLKWIIEDAINFPTPVKHIREATYVLELFHGPTESFKDVGARFMSRCLSKFEKSSDKEITILVATSGDTGSAVASGFYDVEGVNVKILFPKDKVSPYQERQMTSLGKNIKAIEVDGTFDDCQRMVKQAFNDHKLREQVELTSANSINLARLLPQMIYYFLAYKQIKKELKDKSLVVSIPSGNLGNASAGILAKHMGLPIKRFIAAHNANDTFTDYLKTGEYKSKPSVLTFSNAMDVGNPSNYERLAYLYGRNLGAMSEDISAASITDEETVQEMKDTIRETGYLLDPHGAVGKLALERSLKEDELGIFVETAHPNKFQDIIVKAVPDHVLTETSLDGFHKLSMDNDYNQLRDILLS
ncbi:threonine synthase [Nonlabens sp. YIK11]|uniref:threonine synthase n=1 Tax=Nonlabens sp. YIK11 TaxID=1453349 RepID=UPI0006DC207C|nr:threonine synthase [Nonlabens sp. YIK11]KQC33067.1 threonine synthase [Nonlabens sp. YIK11]